MPSFLPFHHLQLGRRQPNDLVLLLQTGQRLGQPRLIELPGFYFAAGRHQFQVTVHQPPVDSQI